MRIRDENKVEAIRAKAIEIIVREGFDGLSMQKLAKAAGVSPATIYIYYRNREDMLNQLFNHVQETFSDVTLEGFDPAASFRDGLWRQWQNRLRFIRDYPFYYEFYQQFRHSPLIGHDAIDLSGFREKMKQFVLNAIRRNELRQVEPEVFWSIAYGSFYALIKFHLEKKTMMGSHFELTDAHLEQTFEMVIKALTP